uniref:interleukin-10-like n=1 Tax=Oncorhynchus gorbuscha TaxID=8017 RepID=UPI001EAED53B|nr:interleukin-10-like [Oncorhynchus gorbuscha]
MSPCSLLLSLLLAAALQCEHAQCRRVPCADRCCSFVEGFPVRLKELRTAFSTIRDYYRNYFSCKKPFDINNLISSYKKMQDKGLYKAMGELDLLFNYIEEYLVSQRRKH